MYKQHKLTIYVQFAPTFSSFIAQFLIKFTKPINIFFLLKLIYVEQTKLN